jgi:hypothetical protein
MSQPASDAPYGFWSGGHAAWWRALRVEIARCKRQRDAAQTAEERQELENRLQELEQDRQGARKQSNRWLF